MATYSKARITCSENVQFNTGSGETTVTKVNPYTNGKLKPLSLVSYKPREAQFPNGSASRQNEILNVMLSPGLIRGMKQFDGLRYLVDGWKSFIEGGYKSQFGQLAYTLDEGNKFVRAIINEPFVEDLQKSTNPLFKQTPSHSFDWSYLKTGGNENYSTSYLTKGTVGQDMCFYFGPGLTVGGSRSVPAGIVSNLFYQKTLPFNIVANETGYLSNVDGLEENVDDDDRKPMETFRWNPIIKIGTGFTIFGNLTGQKKETAQSQIQNSELLVYIKSHLLTIGKSEAFKGSTYADYLRTETECQSFLEGLETAGTIRAGWKCICNSSNNTEEIQKKRIKLIHIEYTPVDCLDKVVFDLTIN